MAGVFNVKTLDELLELKTGDEWYKQIEQGNGWTVDTVRIIEAAMADRINLLTNDGTEKINPMVGGKLHWLVSVVYLLPHSGIYGFEQFEVSPALHSASANLSQSMMLR